MTVDASESDGKLSIFEAKLKSRRIRAVYLQYNFEKNCGFIKSKFHTSAVATYIMKSELREFNSFFPTGRNITALEMLHLLLSASGEFVSGSY